MNLISLVNHERKKGFRLFAYRSPSHEPYKAGKSSSSFDCGSELTLERANAHIAITAKAEKK